MKKEIKKQGNSFVLILSPEDMKCEDMKLGDVIDIQITNSETLKAEEEARIKMGGRVGGAFKETIYDEWGKPKEHLCLMCHKTYEIDKEICPICNQQKNTREKKK